MTVLEELCTTLNAMEISPAVERYVDAIIQQERRLSILGLIDKGKRLEHLTHLQDQRLTTVAIRDDRLPHRYRLAVSAFRLVQYLQLGWLDAGAVHGSALFHEPGCGNDPENSVHVITMDRQSGAIVGYVALLGQSPNHVDRRLSDPSRPLFPCEAVHRINLAAELERVEPETRVGDIWEVKRLVQRSSNASDRELQIATTLHQFHGIFSALDALSSRATWLVGDAQEHVAIKQLRMTVRELTVFEGTNPMLPPDNIYWPAYVARKDVKPFAGRVPRGVAMRELLQDLEAAMASEVFVEKLGILKRRIIDDVRRVAL